MKLRLLAVAVVAALEEMSMRGVASTEQPTCHA
jgi:hypothetical protein